MTSNIFWLHVTKLFLDWIFWVCCGVFYQKSQKEDKNLNNCHIKVVNEHVRERGTQENKMSYVDKCSWCTTPYTVRRGRKPRRRWSRRTASCCCTTCTLSCCWCIHCRWSAWHMASGTAWHCGLLRNIFNRLWVIFSMDVSVGVKRALSLCWALLDYNKQGITLSRELNNLFVLDNKRLQSWFSHIFW